MLNMTKICKIYTISRKFNNENLIYGQLASQLEVLYFWQITAGVAEGNAGWTSKVPHQLTKAINVSVRWQKDKINDDENCVFCKEWIIKSLIWN